MQRRCTRCRITVNPKLFQLPQRENENENEHLRTAKQSTATRRLPCRNQMASGLPLSWHARCDIWPEHIARRQGAWHAPVLLPAPVQCSSTPACCRRRRVPQKRAASPVLFAADGPFARRALCDRCRTAECVLTSYPADVTRTTMGGTSRSAAAVRHVSCVGGLSEGGHEALRWHQPQASGGMQHPSSRRDVLF